MSNASARPDDLRSFTDTALPVTTGLDERRIALTAAYHAYAAAAPGMATTNPDLISVALPDLVTRQHEIITFTDVVREAFEAADSGGVEGGTVTVSEAVLANQVHAVAAARGIDFGAVSAVSPPETIDGPIAGVIPQDSGFVDDPICTATGHFLEVEDDLVMPPRLELLQWRRSYSSRFTRAGSHGTGWWSWADVSLTRDGAGGLLYCGPDGQQFELTLELGDDGAPAGWTAPEGIPVTATAEGDRVVLTWGFRSAHAAQRWTFGPGGALLEVSSELLGTTQFRHEDGRLVALEHEGGRSLRIDWAAFEGGIARIAAIHASDGRSARYTYDETAELVAAGRAVGDRTYAHDDAGLIQSVHDADGVRLCHNTYDGQGRVLRQISPAGRETVLTYQPGLNTHVGDTSDGPAALYSHDDRGRLTSLVNAEGRRFSRSFDADGTVVAQRNFDGTTTSLDADATTSRLTTGDGRTEAWERDEAGRVVATVDPTGVRTTYRYDGASVVPHRIEGPEGWFLELTWRDGCLVGTTDADGVHTAVEVDGDGCTVAVTEADGATTALTVHPSGLPSSVTTPDGSVTLLERDDAGRLTGVVDALGGRMSFEHSPEGRPTAIVDQTGARTTIEWGSDGLVAAIVNPLGDRVELLHDERSELVALLNADQTKWRYDHGLLGQLTMVQAPDGATWTFDHDPEGRVRAVTDPTGATTSVERDAAGYVTRHLAADGAATAVERDELGRVLGLAGPAGELTRLAWDARSRLRSSTDPDGATHSATYTPAGRLATRTTPDGETRHLAYDATGRLAEVRTDDGARWRCTRAPGGRLVELVDPTGGRRRYHHDALGRVVAVDHDGAVVRQEHDAASRVVATTGPGGDTVRYAYDALGRVVAVTDPAGGTTTYRYDAAGHLTGATDALGGEHRIECDPMGRPVAWTDPLGRTTRATYDGRGDLRSTVRPDGTRLDRRLDAAGRVVGLLVDGVAAVRTTYDASGRPIRHETPDGQRIEVTWTPGGRMASWTEAEHGGIPTRTITWRHEAGRPVERVVDGTVDRRWGTDGPRTTTTWTPRGEVVEERDALGRVVAVRGPGGERRWERDPAGRVVRTTTSRDGHEEQVTLERDPAGRVVRSTSPAGTATFAYDVAGQLVEATTPAGRWRFAYDALGRITTEEGPRGTTTATYDAAGQLLATDGPAGRTTHAYDANGRRIASTGAGPDRTYGWDALGRLRSIVGDGVDLSLEVDPTGRLRSAGGVPVRWDPSTGTDRLLSVDGDDVPTPDPSTDAALAVTDRDPWGAPVAGDPHGVVRAGALGQVEVDGLVWLGARPYDPGTRQFLAPDPLPAVVGRPSVGTPYAYAANDPVGMVDPAGLRPLSIEEYDAIRDAATGVQWGNVAAVGIAVAGAVAVAATGGVLAPILVGAAFGAASGAAPGVYDGITTGRWDVGGIVRSATIGAVLGGAGGGFAAATRTALPTAAGLPGMVARHPFATSVASGSVEGALDPVLGYGYDRLPLPGADPSRPLTLEAVVLGGVQGGATSAAGHGLQQAFSGPAVIDLSEAQGTVRFDDFLGTIHEGPARMSVVQQHPLIVPEAPQLVRPQLIVPDPPQIVRPQLLVPDPPVHSSGLYLQDATGAFR